jgi:hypothetical protein
MQIGVTCDYLNVFQFSDKSFRSPDISIFFYC